jgi:DNA-binding transcriptional ArsR family regulator
VEIVLQYLQKALNDENLAYAILGQAILDEGSIQTDKLEIFYNDRSTAYFLYKIAKRWGFADNFRVKHANKQIKYGFTIKATVRAKLYEKIAPLPDKDRDIAFKFLVRDLKGWQTNARAKPRSRIIQSLTQSPKTVREICYELNRSSSTVRIHLKELKSKGMVTILGKNTNSRRGKRKCAFIWALKHE